MTANGYLQLALYVVVLIALAKPLGAYMARVYEGRPALLNRVGAPFESLLYKVCGIEPDREMRWTEYALAALAFAAGLLAAPLAAQAPEILCRRSHQEFGVREGRTQSDQVGDQPRHLAGGKLPGTAALHGAEPAWHQCPTAR